MQNLYGGSPEFLYFLPIGGTATAPLAGFLHEAGHRVEGVDSQLYPPMSTVLTELGITARLGFDPALIPPDLDRVIIGNAVPRHNPEVAAVLDRRLPHLSQAEAVAHYVRLEAHRAWWWRAHTARQQPPPCWPGFSSRRTCNRPT